MPMIPSEISSLFARLARRAYELSNILDDVAGIARTLLAKNKLAQRDRILNLTSELFEVRQHPETLFLSWLYRYEQLGILGQFARASEIWDKLDPLGRGWSREFYRSGDAEAKHAIIQHLEGTLQEHHLTTAERLAAKGKNRFAIRNLHGLRGAWRLEQGEWELAAASFAEAVRMARVSGISDADSETGLALAKQHLGQLAEPEREAERLAQQRKPAHRTLAQLWLALRDAEQAKHHALAAYRWAWADGEPYVHRYELTKTTELLRQMNVPVPQLPPYDPVTDEPFPWEADVRAAIEKLRAKKEGEENE